jgi:peptide/nickel transport system permease protein
MNKEVQSGYSPTRELWIRFKKNRWATCSLILLFLCIGAACLGYLLTPDKTTDGNRILPAMALKSPFSQSLIFRLPQSGSYSNNIWLNGDSRNYQYYVLNEYNILNDTLLLRVVAGAGLPDTTITYSVSKLSQMGVAIDDCIYEQVHLLGTDNLGRDILSRLILGLRISLSVGLIAVFISLSIGILLGALAGYYGGYTDKLIQWIINIIWAIPTVLLVFALTIVLGKGFWQIFIAIGLTIWVSAARLIRGQVMSVKQEQYIEAARNLGYGNLRIIFKHILPNILGPILVIASSNFATAILLEAGLSFLGIGVQPPAPSWGSMIRDNYGYIISDTPYMALIPGFAIMLLVLLLNLIGNGLRDALDVKTKHQ